MTKITCFLFVLLVSSELKAQSLISYYPFNGNANDYVGNNHGTVYGASLTTDKNSSANAAYSFNGTSDYIEIANFPSLVQTSFTISMLVYPRTSGQQSTYLGTGGTLICRNTTIKDEGYSMGMSNYGNDNNKIKWWNKGNGDVWSQNSLYLNEWNCITLVFTYQGNNTNSISIYLNGNLDQTASNVPDIINPTVPLAFGKKSFITGFFDGIMDEIKVWNYDLTAQEVSNEASCVLTNTGIQKINTYSFNILPNPAQKGDQVKIFLPSIEDETILSIYDSKGKLIIEEKSKQQSISQINTSNLAKGIYFLALKNRNQFAYQKLVID
ncbi:MAG: T9SS type A sorting domain-containing protein [Bacteroidetes bacterium]|nr:T9SS type A sorting domain-containing protein [Bacteroidota bacterium]